MVNLSSWCGFVYGFFAQFRYEARGRTPELCWIEIKGKDKWKTMIQNSARNE